MNRTVEQVTPRRCAVYTRKSTSDGLDQDLTSLDVQRQAAESYIASQKNQGWTCLAERYDDGGYTGANTERPALQRLLDDIQAGKVDAVVVYKVDRLSRSLRDFVQLLQFFEKRGVAFVSVTQHFDSSTSMGRLTLNILLSFAQFEREMISERTRDKMAAARKKGKWIGGPPVLGYDIDHKEKKLVANPQEASLVRRIFALYLEERSLIATAQRLNADGVATKRYVTRAGRTIGGVPFLNTSVQSILKNPLYVGKVRFEGKLYPGIHEAIVDEETFSKVQTLLAENAPQKGSNGIGKREGLLSGLLRCKACGCGMFLTYTAKGPRRYLYYACATARKRGRGSCPTMRMNAQGIERAVVEALGKLANQDPPAEGQTPSLGAFLMAIPVWDALVLQEKRRILQGLFEAIDYDGRDGRLGFTFRGELARKAG